MRSWFPCCWNELKGFDRLKIDRESEGTVDVVLVLLLKLTCSHNVGITNPELWVIPYESGLDIGDEVFTFDTMAISKVVPVQENVVGHVARIDADE